MTRRRLRTLRDVVAATVAAYVVFAIIHAIGAIHPLAEFIAVDVLVVLLLFGIVLRWRMERIETSLDASEERYEELFERAGDIVFTVALDGTITSINKAGAAALGRERAADVDNNIAELLAPDFRDWPTEMVKRHEEGPTTILSDVMFIDATGTHTPMEVATQFIYRSGSIAGLQGIARNTAERKRGERRIEYLANHDPLTHLLNRRRFEEELELQLKRSRRDGGESALLFLDLDHFKDVNDSVGHRAGDELLQSVGRLLRSGLREVDVVSRFGGDEFTIILLGAGANEASLVSEKILAAIRDRSFALGGHDFKISASIGIALIPRNGDTAAELLSSADLAMYRAKDDGRNTYHVFQEGADWQAQVSARATWRTRISNALEKDLFRMYAQPILDLHRNKVTHFELLIRLQEGDGRIIEAGEFIGSAERFGLIDVIDRWVVSQALELLTTCAKWNVEATLAVNLSAKTFGDQALLETIRSGIENTGVDPSRLVFEITETAAIGNTVQAQRFVADVKRLGAAFALDDFGAGFSSFHQLKKLDVDYIKIDGSIVRGLAQDVVDLHLVKAIVELARALGKKTVAEFVGSERALELLRMLGVDYAQGYAVGKPEEASKIVIADAIMAPPIASTPGAQDAA